MRVRGGGGCQTPAPTSGDTELISKTRGGGGASLLGREWDGCPSAHRGCGVPPTQTGSTQSPPDVDVYPRARGLGITEWSPFAVHSTLHVRALCHLVGGRGALDGRPLAASAPGQRPDQCWTRPPSPHASPPLPPPPQKAWGRPSGSGVLYTGLWCDQRAPLDPGSGVQR